MLIRSQDKETLANMEGPIAIEILGDGKGHSIMYWKDGYVLGFYSSKKKAIKVLDMIQEAYVNGNIDYQIPEDSEGLYDYILIRTYTWNHSRSGRSCMHSDHVRQAPPRQIKRRTVC